ncbi:uncharacterized protein TNCV_1053171 [Trichonephila clavipes]|nr:uncharacterized protein TNCV_1053171 [Trichonephila clavipes]
MYVTTEILVCPFSNKHSAVHMSSNIVTNNTQSTSLTISNVHMRRHNIYTRALATDHVILNHGQVTWTTPELAPPSSNYHTTPTGGDVSALDRFNVHRCPTRRVFSGTGLEPVTKQATVRYLYHSATAADAAMEVRYQTRSSLSNHVSDNMSNEHFYEITSSKSVFGEPFDY